MPAKLAMSANDLRQCLRIAGGGTLGFFVCKLMNWDYGSFFGVYPMLLLGLTPVINLHIVRQFLANSVVISVEVLVLYGLFGDRPLLMTPIVFGLFVYRFALMARGPLFFFGALSSVFLSMLLHFASYPNVDLFDMLASNMVATWLTVAIAVLMFYLFPDVEPRPPRQAPAKDAPSRRHETLLGATVATLSFVVFQTFDLKDSLSAQIASILVLFPMHWKGVHFAGRIRALGTLLGCALAVGLQVLLYDHYDILPFVALLLWISAMFCARIHMLENGVPGIGFGALTTLAIVLGQYLTPTHDMMYSVLYRFTSVCFAVLITLMTVLVIHLFLNRFAATRHYSH
ncbi:1,4-alpha-glucan branching protein [Pseudomonas aeruginosa]|nr:1,4-alpha-glucan branching protein [Pseudomonas aeruginosa]AON11970.1 1,4-alpha-glucan branching protein [Pseudomonas aeruginosa]AON17957.1 1,4-alpha-glucan branching protein [Pseudomonas aeruginosa]AON24480.1 1,4-alpha-glucan branching protein [Pseudomonas aeruginosa]AON29953.1 1,4-alpha-glucan branching protein [Pseudomonas aeruginosa]